eukprot:CAMPEP_0172178010 /NCGR_PEP_ID=MMETSP1050-20130122/15779_1 /TAXON_ID=233186 /ORGANISM="Cryptomonas curvata, Strain CCAP979/52" /LENGTH=390 /DNA_ID=CAMNT_0012850643 /DNA_START=163 /DNA_END=1332 /DNA_ORIENTATION=-
MHCDKRCWIDVLINRQYDLDSDNVVGLTGDIYSGCDVLILLSQTIFQRAWCLLEAANYTTKGCNIFVVGQCSFLQGENYFAAMKATVPSDERLIKDEIAKMFGADCQAKFNRAIDDAVVQVYGESLLYNGCFQEAVPVFEKELKMKLRRGDDEGSVAATYKQLGRASDCLGNYAEALRYYEEAVQRQVRFFGPSYVSVADTKQNMAIVHGNLGSQTKRLQLDREAHSIYMQALGPEHPKTKGIEPYIYHNTVDSVMAPYGGPGAAPPHGGPAVKQPYGGPAVKQPYGGQAVAPPYGGPAVAQPYGGPAVAPPYGGPAVAPPYGGQTVHYGVKASTRTVALGQDAGELPGATGLTHADFRAGEPVAVLRTSGRHTVGRVTAAWPGWVRVEV